VRVIESELLLSVDAGRNRFRFFVVELRELDDGRVELARRWGRVGASGRTEIEVYEDEEAARVAWDNLLERRAKRGYASAEEEDLSDARRLLAWLRSARRHPRQLAFPVGVGF